MSLPVLGSRVKVRGPGDSVLMATVRAYVQPASVVLEFEEPRFNDRGTSRRELYLTTFRECLIGGAS